MMASTAALPCIHPGCTVARYVTTNGVTYARCQAHQRQYWARIKVPTPGNKPRGPKPGTKYAKKPDAAPAPEAKPTAINVPNRGGVFTDTRNQVVILCSDHYEVLEVALVRRGELHPDWTPAHVKKFYKDAIAIVEKSGVLP